MLKAIIVDDDKIFTKFVQQCVDWDAMNTEVLACAANGNEAIELVGELRPDIIVMDVEMPGVSGLECVEYIRSIRHECEIVLVTGHDEFRYAQLGAKFGVTEILLKPTTKQSLGSAVKRAVNEHWMKRISSCAMNEMVGKDATDDVRSLLKQGAESDSVLGNCADIMSAVQLGEPEGIFKAVSHYLLTVISLNVPYNRMFWLYVFPALICISLLRDNGASDASTPFDDRQLLLRKIQDASLEGNVQQTLYDICQQTSWAMHSKPKCSHSSIADEALALIGRHYTDPKFSISTLSEMMHFHEAYLRRVFKAAFNKSPNTALKETRMNRAIELFATGDMQIQQIAKMVGFDDAAYFSKCFKQHFGYTPSEYRKSEKK